MAAQPPWKMAALEEDVDRAARRFDLEVRLSGVVERVLARLGPRLDHPTGVALENGLSVRRDLVAKGDVAVNAVFTLEQAAFARSKASGVDGWMLLLPRFEERFRLRFAAHGDARVFAARIRLFDLPQLFLGFRARHRIVDFGAFVNILPGIDGMVHISQLSNERVENVTDVLSDGQIVKVKLTGIDERGRLSLSIKAVEE